VVSPAGLGKTLLCQVLVRQFAERFAVATLSSTRLCTRRALLQAILFELGLPFRDMEEGELRLSLIDHVEPGERTKNGMLLLVDEAHTLPIRLLEEIRMITNLVRDGEPRVRVVLAGSGILEERFASPKLESFNQRIAARCFLEPLTRLETEDFVNTQLAAAGAVSCDIFTEDAAAAIHRLTDGIPRLINQVADHALMLATAGGQRQIDAAGIEEAWIDLQQLPAPCSAAASGNDAPTETNVVEFGSLADEADAGCVEFAPTDDAATLDPSATLDEIEQRVADAHQKFNSPDFSGPAPGDEQFDPMDDVRPEVELLFQQAEDPFADEFEEEEIVDPRAIPFRGLDENERAPSEREDLQITGGVDDAPPGQPNLVVIGEAEIADAETPEAEETVAKVHEQVRVADVDETEPDSDITPADDRDIIVIDDHSQRSGEKSPAGRPRRRDYRRLFAQLRQRQA
jgi:type II secretory pathway predicted ATPase ExeA